MVSGRVNLDDAQAIMTELDTGVCHFVRTKKGSLSTRLSNLRLVLTGLGTLLAVIAQFAPPKTYPGNFWALVVCCPLFVIVNGLVTYWLPAQEQNIVCEQGSSLVIRSRLDEDKHSYSLSSTSSKGWKSKSLGQLFEEDGTLRNVVLQDLVNSIL